VTRPTRSAGETVAVSADGHAWQVHATISAPKRHDVIAGAGQAVRYVRLTAGRGARTRHPLIVGELEVRARP
jgi:hypothetical protein